MTIRAVVESHGHFAHGGNPEDTAETWAESGFEAHEVDEWLKARCFDPSAARDLADAGIDPDGRRHQDRAPARATTRTPWASRSRSATSSPRRPATSLGVT